MPICENCNKTFPNRIIIDGIRRNLSSRKYCLECTPFGSHNTLCLTADGKRQVIPHGCTCGETDPDKFYGKLKGLCKKCFNDRQTIKSKEKRNYILDKLGGECVVCGFKKYRSSLAIHHTDPSKKDETFASIYGWSYKRIDKEIETCILLCANCHTAFHAGIDIFADKDSQSEQ